MITSLNYQDFVNQQYRHDMQVKRLADTFETTQGSGSTLWAFLTRLRDFILGVERD